MRTGCVILWVLLLAGCATPPAPTPSETVEPEPPVEEPAAPVLEGGAWAFLAPPGDNALRLAFEPGPPCSFLIQGGTYANGTVQSIHWEGDQLTAATFIDVAVRVAGTTVVPVTQASHLVEGPAVYGHFDDVASGNETSVFAFVGLADHPVPALMGGNLALWITCDGPRNYTAEFAHGRILQPGSWDEGVQAAVSVGPSVTAGGAATVHLARPTELWGFTQGDAAIRLSGPAGERDIPLVTGFIEHLLDPGDYTATMERTVHELGPPGVAFLPFEAPGALEDSPWPVVSSP